MTEMRERRFFCFSTHTNPTGTALHGVLIALNLLRRLGGRGGRFGVLENMRCGSLFVCCLLDEDKLGDRTSSTIPPRHKSLHRGTLRVGLGEKKLQSWCLSVCRDTHGVLGEGVLGCMG